MSRLDLQKIERLLDEDTIMVDDAWSGVTSGLALIDGHLSKGGDTSGAATAAVVAAAEAAACARLAAINSDEGMQYP